MYVYLCGIENECIQIAFGEKPIEKFIKKVKVEKTRLHTDARGNKLKRRAVCIRITYIQYIMYIRFSFANF